MKSFIENLKAKYRAKIKPTWPLEGDHVHFTDRYCKGRLYFGKVLGWVSTGIKEENIYWRVEVASGDVINCGFDELAQVYRSPENATYVEAYNRGEV